MLYFENGLVAHGKFALRYAPSNELPAAVPFWERLGFARTGGDGNYIIMAGWGSEVHLTQAGTGPWRVPENKNPFGVFIRTPDVDAGGAGVDDLIIRPRGVLRHREWGLYECRVAGPDGLLVDASSSLSFGRAAVDLPHANDVPGIRSAAQFLARLPDSLE
jgi:hypothetical protein